MIIFNMNYICKVAGQIAILILLAIQYSFGMSCIVIV